MISATYLSWMNDIMKNASSFILDQQNQKPCGKDLVLKKKKWNSSFFYLRCRNYWEIAKSFQVLDSTVWFYCKFLKASFC